MDLAVGDNNYPQGVSVLLGNSDGTFQSATHNQTPGGPRAGIVADMNRDGNLDLAFSPYDGTGAVGVYIFIGNGDGTFQPEISYRAGAGANSLKGADFNGDGLLDLAVANVESNNVSVLVGNGDGTFRSPVNYAIGLSPLEIAVTDLDGDDKQDLAATNNGSNNVSILLGNGDGIFQAPLNYAAGSNPIGIDVGDSDANGKTDMAVTNNISNTVSIMLNTCAIYVTSIEPSYRPIGRGFEISTRITVNPPIPDAQVNLKVTYPNGSKIAYPLTTDNNGVASVSFITTRTGTYRFTVLKVRADGRTYDLSLNVETRDRLMIP
jgi:FG-GAP-like repeat